MNTAQLPDHSQARDHLADERAYLLAWLRTAGSIMVLGLAVARFVPARGVDAWATLAYRSAECHGVGRGSRPTPNHY